MGLAGAPAPHEGPLRSRRFPEPELSCPVRLPCESFLRLLSPFTGEMLSLSEGPPSLLPASQPSLPGDESLLHLIPSWHPLPPRLSWQTRLPQD